MSKIVREGRIIGQAIGELRIELADLPFLPSRLRERTFVILEEEMPDHPGVDIEDAIRYYHIVKGIKEVAAKVRHEPIGSAIPVPTIKMEMGDTELELRGAKLVVVRRDT